MTEATSAQHRGQDSVGQKNLDLFIKSEFDGFNARDFALLSALHADDVRVQMPDGSVVVGNEQHMADLTAMVTWAPDLHVVEHTTKLADGDWIAAVGLVVGSFTEPMPLPDGRTLEPTGRSLRIQIATIARWEEGKIAEESLFWDSGAFNAQLGIGG